MEMRKKVGRPAGAVNKTTKVGRQALVEFINGNIPRLNMLLDQVEKGLPKIDKSGEYLRDKDGSIIYVVKPDPLSTINAISTLAEFVLPKLSRQDVNMTAQVSNVDLIGQMSPQAQMLANMNPDQIASFLRGETAKVIEGEVVEPLPEFLRPLEHDHE
jgi:hypothetical protein